MLLGAWPCVVAVPAADGGDDNVQLPDDGYSLTLPVNARVAVVGRVGLKYLVRDNVAVVAPSLVDLVHGGTCRML